MHESVTSFIEAETSQLLKEIDSALGNKYDLGKASVCAQLLDFSGLAISLPRETCVAPLYSWLAVAAGHCSWRTGRGRLLFSLAARARTDSLRRFESG